MSKKNKKNKVEVKLTMWEDDFSNLIGLLEEYCNIMHSMPADMKVEEKIGQIESMIFELEGAE